MAKKKAKAKRPRVAPIEPLIQSFMQSLPVDRATRPARVHFELSGADGGAWSIECAPEHVRIASGAAEGHHHVQVRGEASALRPVLEGKLEPAAAYVRGGLRIEGDIAHIDQLVELMTRAVRARAKSGRRG